jgi:hypothetical protein
MERLDLFHAEEGGGDVEPSKNPAINTFLWKSMKKVPPYFLVSSTYSRTALAIYNPIATAPGLKVRKRMIAANI